MAVTAEHFDQYKAEWLKQVKPVSVNIELRALRAAFSTAKRWRLIESDPFSEVELASVPERTPLFLTIKDAKRLLACIHEDWLREAVLFALLTGMRRSEVLNLKWENVDFSRRLIHIESNPSFKTKQGRRRTIPLNATALRLVRSRQGKSSCEYVFSLNDRPIYGNWVQHLFKRYVRRAGLSEGIHFHSLRHTFASWLVQSGASLYEIQKLLGHSGPQVTQIYAHLSPSELHETVDKITVS
jgi:integrase